MKILTGRSALIAIIAIGFFASWQPFAWAGKYQPAREFTSNRADNGLLLSVADVITLKKQNTHAILVDVRNEAAFEKTRIPESINVPLPFVKTKQYLRDMQIVLVDNGYNFTRLLREAKVLKEKGFDVSILAGGLAAWHQKGGKLVGDLFNLERFYIIPAHYLLPGNRSLLFQTYIDISSKQNPEMQSDFPEVIHIPVKQKEDFQQVISVIEEKTDPLSAVLIFNNDGNYDPIASLPESCAITGFYLKDGLNGYQRAARQHHAMLQTRDQRLKKVGGCTTCPDAEDNKIKSKKNE